MLWHDQSLDIVVHVCTDLACEHLYAGRYALRELLAAPNEACLAAHTTVRMVLRLVKAWCHVAVSA